MRLATLSAVVLLSVVTGAACAQQPTAPARSASAAGTTRAVDAAPSMSRSHSSDVPEPKWGPAPAVFPAGAQMAVMSGDPGGTGLFTVRLRFPNGYRIAPHTHPTDEHVTVISGTFLVGMGEQAKREGMLKLKAGDFITAPANHAHYASTQGPTVVQVHAMGPFAMTYINPADTPVASR